MLGDRCARPERRRRQPDTVATRNTTGGSFVPPTNAVIRPAAAADLDRVAGIFAHYVTTSTVTFEDIPPTVADWQHRLDDLARLGLPFLVARTGGDVAGYAYACPWRSKPAYRHTVEDS